MLVEIASYHTVFTNLKLQDMFTVKHVLMLS